MVAVLHSLHSCILSIVTGYAYNKFINETTAGKNQDLQKGVFTSLLKIIEDL